MKSTRAAEFDDNDPDWKGFYDAFPPDHPCWNEPDAARGASASRPSRPRLAKPPSDRSASEGSQSSLAEHLDLKRVGQLVGLHPKVVKRAIDDGQLRASKLRGRWRIAPADVEAWIEAGRAHPYPVPEIDPT